MTNHNIYIGASQHMSKTTDCSVDLIVTSPPYPMIEMWDASLAMQNEDIATLIGQSPDEAFELMHHELDAVWTECLRVLKPGGFLCINIGDATRTINGLFKLYNNHARIIQKCSALGFTELPSIIWRKPTNSPNKFMGSGMLPCGAYVTLEHEWILIFRKGDKRVFKTQEEKIDRMKSSYFWEERNIWFSDMWDVKGIKQTLLQPSSRERSAAYPFEIPYRLINMFSQKGDTVLDPFLGTGTTTIAAILLGRNSVGYEIEETFKKIITEKIEGLDVDMMNALLKQRFDAHVKFITNRMAEGKDVKHYNAILNTPVMTKQEECIEFNYINSISFCPDENCYKVIYENCSDMNYLPMKTELFMQTV